MPQQLVEIQDLITQALAATHDLWLGLARAFQWIYLAVHVLNNAANFPAEAVERRFQRVLAAMERECARGGPYAEDLAHFLEVTQRYRSGLFICYRVPGVPRTNNDLEQMFGSYRHHERRASGRKVPAGNLATDGPTRLPASAASRQRTFTADDLVPADPEKWRQLHQRSRQNHRARLLGRRFHRNPQAYLADLEEKLLQPPLPS